MPRSREAAVERDAPTTTEPKGSARRQELLKIAAETFADLGYSRTKIRDIAQRAKILNGSLYHHFPSKEAMLDELLQPYFDNLLSTYDRVLATEQEPEARFAALIRETVLMAAQRRGEVAVLQRDWDFLKTLFPYVASGLRRAEKVWISVLEQGIADGTFRDDVSPRLGYHTIQAAMSGVSQWYRPGGRIAIGDVADAQTRIFLAGMLNPDRPQRRK